MCILEAISFTRKDGQYLRWDSRSGRGIGGNPFDKGPILPFSRAIESKLDEIAQDLEGGDATLFGEPVFEKRGEIQLLAGSCLDILPALRTSSFDAIVTSPPYCNRYDYTRTYALELAMMGVEEEGIKKLRQCMLSCTVENREKYDLHERFPKATFKRAMEAFESQEVLQ